MARPLRIEFPGAIYHIASRGNARLPIFEDDEDRTLLLDTLQEATKRFHWFCHAYCLMNNHYHLLIETPDGNLSHGMRHLNGVYTQRFNRRHNRAGHIFQGRFKSILVERDSYLLEVCRYIVLNPVRAGMAETPDGYQWSSYRATVGLCAKPPFLSVDWILGQFASRRPEARKRFRQFVLEGIAKKIMLWNELKDQCVLGTREFIEKISPALKSKSEQLEIPRRERLVFRPSLEDLFPEKTKAHRNKRNKAVRVAHLTYGYGLSEIANLLGLHYTTISKIINS
jgi:putative transposase